MTRRKLVVQCDGVIAVEFALIFPILLLLIIGGIDVGLAMLSANKLNFAAEAAARCQAIGAPACAGGPGATEAYANSVSDLTGATFMVATTSCGTQVTGSFSYPAMILPSIPMSARACYP